MIFGILNNKNEIITPLYVIEPHSLMLFVPRSLCIAHLQVCKTEVSQLSQGSDDLYQSPKFKIFSI